MGKLIDIRGQKFGKLTAIEPTRKNGRAAWKCICDCGKEVVVDSGNLRNGKTKSCGCAKSEFISQKVKKDLTGQKFGKLLVLEATSDRVAGAIVWKCKCDCGNLAYIPTGNLTSGHTQSCGCKEHIGHRKDLLGQKFGRLEVIEFLGTNEDKSCVWKCKCECGNITEVVGWHLTCGIVQSCGCLRSKGEAKIIKILQEAGIPFEKEKIFENCKFDNGKHARFDFYVNDTYIIEYDGEQHFTYNGCGWSTKENLEKVQERDKFKDEWCKNNGIPIIRIPYTKYSTLTLEDLIYKGE